MVEGIRLERKISRLLLLTLTVLLLESQQGHAGWYLGCFNEKPENRAFNISAGNYIVSDTSAQECTSACAYLNQSYAATEGDLCLCANGSYNKYGQAASEQLCDLVCSDAQSCNDTSHIRVYSTQDAIGGLEIQAPQIGWLLQKVNFTSSVGKGDFNVSYTYDFGDGSYVLTTCPNVSHVYTRVGHFHVKVSARNNISGPIMASTWVFIQSSTGLVTLDYPQGIVESENETEIVLSVSQGTWMTATWLTSPSSGKKIFNISDAVVHEIGSSATLGNDSSSPETDGAYVIPTAMLKKDGYILAWEFVASKGGSIRIQVYRPSCPSVNDQFCPKNLSCIAKVDTCFSSSLFSCPDNNICVGSGRCLSNCQKGNISFPSSATPLTDYRIVAESLISNATKGKNLITLAPEKAIQVRAGDIIGWVGNGSSGALAFEQTIYDPSFFYPSSKFSITIRGTLSASGDVRRHEIKHVLRAHVSQPSLAAVNINFVGAGLHKVTAVVDNVAESELKTCEVSVQERIRNLAIIKPLTSESYGTGAKVLLQSAMDKGSNISYTWTANGATYNLENPEIVFIYSGHYPISVNARNNISSADAASIISVLNPVSLSWLRKPPSEVDVGARWNASVILNGTNVTVSISYGDGSSVNESFYETDQNNTVITFWHDYTSGGEKQVIVTAKNNISGSPSTLSFPVKAKSEMGEILIQLRPAATVSGVLKISTKQNFGITVSTAGDQPVNYTFQFSDEFTSDPIVTADGDTKITHSYDKETNYDITMSANITGYSEKRFVHVIAKPCGPPGLYFPDSYTENDPQVITKASRIRLETNVQKQDCALGELQYVWSIYRKGNSDSYELMTLPSAETSGPSYEIEPGSFEAGNYSASLNVSYKDSNTQEVEKYFFKTYIRVEKSDLVTVISGGSSREVDPRSSEELTLDASGSHDPDSSQTSLGFKWECKFENNSVPSVPDELCASTTFVKLSETSSILTYPFSKFREHVTYSFKVMVTKDTRSAFTIQDVKLVPNIPSLEISCRNCLDKINPQERVTLEGKCTNCDGADQQLTNQTWKLLDENGIEDIRLSGNRSVTDSDLGWNSINLVLKDRILKEDATYIAQLTATRGNRQSTVQFRFQTTSPPKSGTCRVAPKSGVASETFFDMKCSDWVTIDNPISYQFQYKVKLTDLAKINTLSSESEPSQLWYYGDRYTPSSKLPLGDANNNFMLGLSVRICNKFDCCTKVHLNAKVRPRILTPAEYNQLQENTTQELNSLDPKSNPGEVSRVVISVASSINYDDKSDPETKNKRKEIRSKLIDNLEKIDLTDSKQAQLAISALITVSQNKEELTPQSQNKAAKLIGDASSLLKNDAKDKNFGPVKVEEDSRGIYTAASNVLEASKETSLPFVLEALKDSIPTTAPPSRDWALRNSFLKSEQDAQESRKVVDSIVEAIDTVSEAIQRKKVAEEGQTEVQTPAFLMKLKRSRKAALDSTIMEGSEVRVKMPDPSVILKDYEDDESIDAQYTSMSNAFLSDPKWSPYINTRILGFSLKQNNKEIRLHNLEQDLEMNIPVDLTQVSNNYSAVFTANTIKKHRYQVPPDTPYKRLIVHVKPRNGETLKVNLSINFEASSSLYKLRFPAPLGGEEIPAPFRKVDNFSYIAGELPSSPIYFNLNVTVAEPFTGQEESGGESRAVHVNYTVAIYSVQCRYWDRKRYEWLDTGCKVGDKTTFKFTQCLCNHATFFASLNVKPNPIDPPTFAALKEGYAMLVFVSLIFMLYFLGLIWARRKDKADIVKVGVCPLRDNDPSDPYRYELTLWTGMRRNAGTKSKVSIIVYGDESDSEARALEDTDRNPFQRGSQDTFLLTTPNDLGTIQYIRIWHDNVGGSWFLSRIMVIDLQTEERYYFICNRWLAVDEEDGQVERLVPLASKEELTEFGHLFVARTRRNLSDSHLWFSVLARPANSRFTRVQRLSCCLCLLLMSMMASGMYYGRQSDPADVQYVGQIVFTWQQVLIGIISSLIVFPINLFVVQIFRNVRPKPRVKPKKPPPQLPTLSFTKENLENYNQLKESSDESTKGSNNSLDSSREKNNRTRLSINDVHTDVDRASFTDSPLLIDRRLSTTYDIAPTSRFRRALLFFKKKNSLPYYFVYLAWALVFIFSTGSAVVVVLYGIQFKNVKSLQWLFSSSVSFVQDVLITQPLKVLGLAVFFALVVKKPDKGEFEITEETLKLAEDEEFLQQSSSNQGGKRTKKTHLLPPDQAKLIAMRAARMKERKMYSVIREIATYYVFLALLLTIAYTHRDQVAYLLTRNLVNTMGENFSKITNEEEFWKWSRQELLEGLFPSEWYNGEPRKRDGFMADGSSQMVGGARMRLLRIKKESCQVPTEVYGITKECYGEYFITKDDKNDYTEGWKNITTYETKISWDDMMWRYQNGSQLDGYPFWAKLATYSGGGYVIVLEPGMDNINRIKRLERSLWIERHTRAILTEFTIYNAQTNLFCVVTLVAEFPAIGAVIPHVSVQTARLYDFTDSYMFFVVTINIIFVLFILFFAYREAKNIYKTGIQAYIKGFWNCVEFGIVVFTFAAIALYVYRALTVRNVLDLVRHDPFNFKSFQFVAYWDETYTFILAIIVLLANIKLNKLLRFNKRFSLLASTLKYAYYPLLMFSIIWGIVFTAFTLFASLVFGPNLANYRSVMASLTSLLSLMLGRTAYFEMRDTNRILGPLFFFGFMFMMSFVLINMFLSIVVDSFRVVKHDNDKQSNEYEIVDFIIERFKLWSGIGKTRRPHSRRRVLWDTAATRVKAVNAFKDRPHSVTIAGLHVDTVSELENRLEKLVDRTDVLYDELFPEKRRIKFQGKLGKVPVSKGDLLEGQKG